MSNNDRVILQQIIEQGNSKRFPNLKSSKYFEFFCAEQILKNYDLSYDELFHGLVDGEHDGGIDAVYSFVNGNLIFEDFDPSKLKTGVEIELVIIQSKSAKGFNEEGLNRISSALRKLLDLGADYDNFPELNGLVKSRFSDFRNAYLGLSSTFPKLSISIYYCALKADSEIHPNIVRKKEEVLVDVENAFSNARTEVNLLGASELLSIARRIPKSSFTLKTEQNLSDGDGYVVLVKLEEFNRFLRDENGNRIERIFESNVRDNQGNVPVNREIRTTLRAEKTVDFWMMNNGVTIVADQASLSGQQMDIESPQIVNGLQTSTQVLEHFDELQFAEENRKIMVKVVPLTDDESRDKIIKATNSQTNVTPSSLRATDRVQRDIEETLKSHDLYYDRRKNFYKNKGVEPNKIIGIPLLAQVVMATLLGRPDDARARPGNLLNDEKAYPTLFSKNYPIGVYACAALVLMSVDEALAARTDLSAKDKNNIRFYVMYYAITSRFPGSKVKAQNMGALVVNMPSSEEVNSSLEIVWQEFQKLGAKDTIAKGPTLLTKLQAVMKS